MITDFNYIISNKDLQEIGKQEFSLSQEIGVLLPQKKSILLKVFTPNLFSATYSIIRNNTLFIDENLMPFFSSFKQNDSIYIKIKQILTDEKVIDCKIYFSKSINFTDLKNDTNPTVSKSIISIIKEFEPVL